MHLAVMAEPYLGFVLEHRKTIESRFSVHRIAPYDNVTSGDVLMFKRTSGPVVGVAIVARVFQYELDERAWDEIRVRFGRAICVPPEFYESRTRAAYATLMEIERVRAIPDIVVEKRDRRGWVILSSGRKEVNLF